MQHISCILTKVVASGIGLWTTALEPPAWYQDCHHLVFLEPEVTISGQEGGAGEYWHGYTTILIGITVQTWTLHLYFIHCVLSTKRLNIPVQFHRLCHFTQLPRNKKEKSTESSASLSLLQQQQMKICTT